MKMKKILSFLLAFGITFSLLGQTAAENVYASESDEEVQTVTLRVCNWEEYIDLGDWDESEVIDLENGDIFGENSMVDDFEEWYYETYGIRCKVEYSTFGTNEDLYNMLTLGDVYDVVCPSEYMFMKLCSEDMLMPLSDEFFDESNEYNYYVKGVSPYMKNIFETHTVDGKLWKNYAAGYMWGITGFVYNPDVVTQEEASTMDLLSNTKFRRQITIKDNVRDSYFMAVGAVKSDLLLDPSFTSSDDYNANLETEMNDVSDETMQASQDFLQGIKDNLYSFETDSGKADMITGKVVANYQWSGDAVYTMDQAEEDGYYLDFAVPEEVTNIYFDAWVMLKKGIEQDPLKQQAAEAWINFLSRPDNVVRDEYYIGYTSVISGGDDPTVYNYLLWNYGAEDDEEDVVDYDVSWFFSGWGHEGEYVFTVPEEQTHRQLSAQYPTAETLARSAIMIFFPSDINDKANQMWINVRCYNIHKIPAYVWFIAAAVIAFLIYILIRLKRQSY